MQQPPASTRATGTDELSQLLKDSDPAPTSFRARAYALSEVLAAVIEGNPDLRTRVIDREVSEQRILAALGAYDVIITGRGAIGLDKSTPRGSALRLQTGSRSQMLSFGASRQLESGGRIELSLAFSRDINDQPVSFFDPAAGSASLANYRVQPRIELTHPLLRGFGLELNQAPIRLAKLARTQAEAFELQTSQDLVRDVLVAYWDLAFAEKDLANRRSSANLAREQYRRIDAQVQAGRSSPVEAKAAAQSVVTRESETIAAEFLLLERSINLHRSMGHDMSRIDAHGITAATDPDFVEVTNYDVNAEIERALQAHPQIRQLELALATRRIEELQAANQRLPQLDVDVSFSPRGVSGDRLPDARTGVPGDRGSWGEAFRNFGARNEDGRPILADFSVNAGVTFNWDVQNRTAKAQHEMALLEVRRAQVNLGKLRHEVAANVVRWVGSYRSAAKRMQAQELAVELSLDNLAAENARYDVGRSTIYDVLQRIDDLTQARGAALNAKIELIKARTQLQALTGQLLAAYGLELARHAGRN